MANAALQHSGTTLALQTLIEARHKILRQRTGSHIGRSDFPGQRTGPRRGQGLEFIDLRQYNSGDDVRHIDWNVTARSNEPYTRLYREEREHVSTVVVDLRPSMFTGSVCLRAVSAGWLAASLLWQASYAGDRCAAMVISSNGVQSTRPAAGNAGVLRALELIASEFAACADNSTATSEQPLSATLEPINQRRQSGSYFFFSGFDTQHDKHWHQLLPATAMTGQMNAIMLLDPLEISGLPAGAYRYRTEATHNTTTINRTNRAELERVLQRNIQQRKRQFESAGIPLIAVSTASRAEALLATLQQRKWL